MYKVGNHINKLKGMVELYKVFSKHISCVIFRKISFWYLKVMIFTDQRST